jgi:hypothetical protein
VSAPSLAATVAAVAPPIPSPTTITSYSVWPGRCSVVVVEGSVEDVVVVGWDVLVELAGMVVAEVVEAVEEVVVDGVGLFPI